MSMLAALCPEVLVSTPSAAMDTAFVNFHRLSGDINNGNTVLQVTTDDGEKR